MTETAKDSLNCVEMGVNDVVSRYATLVAIKLIILIEVRLS